MTDRTSPPPEPLPPSQGLFVVAEIVHGRRRGVVLLLLMAELRSPVTGELGTFKRGLRRDGFVSTFADRVGTWHLADPILDMLQGFIDPSCTYRPGYTPDEMAGAWLVVRSKIWLQQLKKMPPVCVITRGHFDSLRQRSDFEEIEYTLVSFDACVAEAKALLFEDKCRLTLQNLDLCWQETGEPVVTGFEVTAAMNNKTEIRLLPIPARQESGMAYGCDERSALLVYQYLERRGWIQPTSIEEDFEGWYTAPDGELQLDQLRERGVNLNQAFFVRPWDETADDFFGQVQAEVQRRTNVVIKAVWDTVHNDQIDERVMRQIRESAAVVAEINNKKFNVGFEVGYALALGKPIVAIRKRPTDPTDVYPLDIATLHRCEYDEENLEELIDKLSEKLLVAISTAKMMAR